VAVALSVLMLWVRSCSSSSQSFPLVASGSTCGWTTRGTYECNKRCGINQCVTFNEFDFDLMLKTIGQFLLDAAVHNHALVRGALALDHDTDTF